MGKLSEGLSLYETYWRSPGIIATKQSDILSQEGFGPRGQHVVVVVVMYFGGLFAFNQIEQLKSNRK